MARLRRQHGRRFVGAVMGDTLQVAIEAAFAFYHASRRFKQARQKYRQAPNDAATGGDGNEANGRSCYHAYYIIAHFVSRQSPKASISQN